MSHYGVGPMAHNDGNAADLADAPGHEGEAVQPLESSSREVLKGTLVPLRLSLRAIERHGLVKFGAARQLGVTPGETEAVVEHMDAARAVSRQRSPLPLSAQTLDLFRSFERALVPGLRPGLASVAAVPLTELAAFAEALVQVRAQKARLLNTERASFVRAGDALQSLNAAVVTARYLANDTAVQPLGMLNLERIEMVPSGIERGELVATIPLAPGETTAVTHKEWSVTSSEFTTIVTDSLENTSETGVTDNNDLSQSTTSQNQHANQFNITGTVQGGIPMINGSSTTGFTAQDSTSLSATDSIKHATSMTQKAAARSRQEHKTTISTTTVTGTEETSTRVLVNTSKTDAIRVDYFSLIRKWRVRLYRFGLRLTYDIVVPEPGAAMRRTYAELDVLRQRLGPFVFTTKLSEVTNEMVDEHGVAHGNPTPPGVVVKPRYQWLADRHGVAVKPYPTAPPALFKSVRGAGALTWSYLDLDFNVPVGASVTGLYVSALIGNNDKQWPWLRVMGARDEPDWQDKSNLELHDAKVFAQDGSPFMIGAVGPDQHVTFWLWRSDSPSITLKVTLETTPETIAQWQQETFNALFTAAQTRHFAEQQEIAQRISAIEDSLAHVDTLTMRREESDEIMKCVLKFILGTSFDFMPPAVRQAFAAEGVDLVHGVAFDGQSLSKLSPEQWSVLRQHEDIVRFINQAIEWENVVTFLYSYFWDVPDSWAFIRGLRSPDPTRQAFLRAGSARVVLTVRKGWEQKWLRFTQDETIEPDEPSRPGTGPYQSIAQEIAAYDDRNYPGIPPANPAKAAVRLEDAVYTTSSDTIPPTAGTVSIEVESSAGIVAGLPVVLDVEDEAHIQETVTVTEVPDETHIVVRGVVHPHDGKHAPFAVLQPGNRGALIAEWNEYTPSSGTDIAMTSKLTTIA